MERATAAVEAGMGTSSCLPLFDASVTFSLPLLLARVNTSNSAYSLR